MLRAIKREVLPEVLRVTLELDRETVFKDDRIDGPPRVFVDLQNTRAGTPIQDARLGYDDDVVRQIRVGRQLDRRIRVVLDLSEAPRHSVYTLYNPFRVVIDFERRRAAVAPPVTERIETEALLPLSDPDDPTVPLPPVPRNGPKALARLPQTLAVTPSPLLEADSRGAIGGSLSSRHRHRSRRLPAVCRCRASSVSASRVS
jgi:N-acetylmuramoyl-L-alanine amidase